MASERIKLIIHIGQPKTGTSAIQGFLDYNRNKLAAENGIIYPNLNHKDFLSGRQHNHAHFFAGVLDNDSIKNCVVTFEKLKKFCLRNNKNRIVISNEGFFSHRWPKYIRELIDHFDFDYHIILYLRRQDKYAESAWKQWGHKNPLYNTIFDYIDNINLNWKRVIDVWLEYFDLKNFSVRPYEKSTIGNDTVVDFMKILGVNKLSDFVSPPKSNQVHNIGFNRDVIEVLKLCRSIIKSQHDNKLLDFMYKSVPEKYQKKPFEEYDFLSPNDKLELIKKYEKSNNEIAKIFSGNQVNKLFNDPLPNPSDFWKPYEGLTIEKFVPIVMEILYNQQKIIETQEKSKGNIIKEKVKSSIVCSRVNIRNRVIFKKSLFQKQIKDVKLHKDGIIFTVVGHDPAIILPHLKLLKVAKQMIIDITVPEKTLIYIFYKTKRLKHYSKKRFLKTELSKGRNTVIVDIPSSEVFGRLRLDPGTQPGNYILHRIAFLTISSFLILKSLRTFLAKTKNIFSR